MSEGGKSVSDDDDTGECVCCDDSDSKHISNVMVVDSVLEVIVGIVCWR